MGCEGIIGDQPGQRKRRHECEVVFHRGFDLYFPYVLVVLKQGSPTPLASSVACYGTRLQSWR